MKRLIEIKTALSMRLDVRAVAAAPPGFEVREVPRAELEATLGGTVLARAPAELDVTAPHGWRAFVAFADGAPVHVTFVERRPGRPLTFGGLTDPQARGRGAKRATVAFVAARLREEGESRLFSSVDAANLPSIRAQTAAGFVVERRTVDVRVLGVSLRGLARRLLGHR
ncbi:MAG TPA: hypothetical protein VHJ20_18410 [Polyangia bacterium]|nr:hypothetical protein [Polyangia bacterium]